MSAKIIDFKAKGKASTTDKCGRAIDATLTPAETAVKICVEVMIKTTLDGVIYLADRVRPDHPEDVSRFITMLKHLAADVSLDDLPLESKEYMAGVVQEIELFVAAHE